MRTSKPRTPGPTLRRGDRTTLVALERENQRLRDELEHVREQLRQTIEAPPPVELCDLDPYQRRVLRTLAAHGGPAHVLHLSGLSNVSRVVTARCVEALIRLALAERLGGLPRAPVRLLPRGRELAAQLEHERVA